MQGSGGCAYVARWECHHNEQDRTDLYVSYTCGTSATALGGAVTDDWDYNNLSKPSMAWYDGKLHIAYTRVQQRIGTQAGGLIAKGRFAKRRGGSGRRTGAARRQSGMGSRGGEYP